MFVENSFTNWTSWVSRHPNEFLLTTGALVTGIATVVLALITIVLYKSNSRLIKLNVKQFNRRYISQLYEDLLLLMNDTLGTVNSWVTDLQNSTQGFMPGITVSREEVQRQRKVAIETGIKLDLYPNAQINPLIQDWMGLLAAEMIEFAGLYNENERDAKGNYTISDERRSAAIMRLKETAEKLESQKVAIIQAMSLELRI